jgi:hypothetical protein
MTQPIRIFFPRRKSTSSPVPDPVISYGDKSMVLDTQHMPRRLVNLLPFSGWAHIDVKEFEPFCRQADAEGYFR